MHATVEFKLFHSTVRDPIVWDRLTLCNICVSEDEPTVHLTGPWFEHYTVQEQRILI